MLKRFAMAIVMFLSLSLSTTYAQTPISSTENSGCSILTELRLEFQKRNPNIAHVKIVDVRPTLTEIPKYLVLGWGVRADRTFRGNFADELFGLFLVDESLSGVEKVLDFIPTPRWYDTEMRMTRVDASKAVLEARGETYGGRYLRRVYDLRKEGRISPAAPNRSPNRTRNKRASYHRSRRRAG